MNHVIIKYENRKLYSKKFKRYISLEELETLINNNNNFTVQDFKNKEDITHDTLVKILANKLIKIDNPCVNNVINLIQNI